MHTDSNIGAGKKREETCFMHFIDAYLSFSKCLRNVYTGHMSHRVKANERLSEVHLDRKAQVDTS